MIQEILRFFPSLTSVMRRQFATMAELYPEWNAKINVISRKDIDNLEVHHLLHSMAIARFITFTRGSRILDLGCGGGLPGLPLAVLFPECEFHLVDRVGKKIGVARAIAEACGLQNVTLQHGDSGECPRRHFDFVVSRAVMPLPDLVRVARPHIAPGGKNAYPNGLISLKGGELSHELSQIKSETLVEHLATYFPGVEFFDTKVLTYTPLPCN